ncbi:hypothetical protein CHS0354_021345 [Potamilus streckersoni]|uniref:Uncharacterized protein n=1 Tax=Potamilus streckersoni TaxID=2493646 RepID=A0AAE0S3E1_9BIVA|nr:hypothetical protein CHS0354_021345 [Potamilus streckersoni]
MNIMNKSVTPHDYKLRSRPAPELLTPLHFTPPGFTKSKTAANAPPFAIDRLFLPTTSILLHGISSTYTSPVTIYPPLPTLPMIQTSSARTTQKPASDPILQPLPDDVLIDLTQYTPTPEPVFDHSIDSSLLPPTPSSQLHLTLNILLEVLVFLGTTDSHTQLMRFESIFHHDDVILDLSILQTQQGSSESIMDYLSRLFQIATNKQIPDQVLLAVALKGLKPSVKRIVMNKNPANMAELRQAAVLAEKSITTTDTTDLSTLNTILKEVKQLKDEVVAN